MGCAEMGVSYLSKFVGVALVAFNAASCASLLYGLDVPDDFEHGATGTVEALAAKLTSLSGNVMRLSSEPTNLMV